jgi:hypothetical protein
MHQIYDKTVPQSRATTGSERNRTEVGRGGAQNDTDVKPSALAEQGRVVVPDVRHAGRERSGQTRKLAGTLSHDTTPEVNHADGRCFRYRLHLSRIVIRDGGQTLRSATAFDSDGSPEDAEEVYVQGRNPGLLDQFKPEEVGQTRGSAPTSWARDRSSGGREGRVQGFKS